MDGESTRIAGACRNFEAELIAGGNPRIEQYLNEVSASDRTALIEELLTIEIEFRLQRGESPRPEEFHHRFPEHAESIAEILCGSATPLPTAGPREELAGTAAESVDETWLPEREGATASSMTTHRKALHLRESLVRKYPAVPTYRDRLAVSYNNLGLFYGTAGKTNQARDAFDQAVAILKRLTLRHPDTSEFRIDLATAYVNRAKIIDVGAPNLPLKRIQMALELLHDVVKREPKNIVARDSLRGAYKLRARIHDSRRDFNRAADDWLEALRWAAGDRKTECSMKLTVSLTLAKRHQEAVHRADGLARRIRSATSVYTLARVYAICSAVAGHDRKLSQSERNDVSERYARKSVVQLERAASLGLFKNPRNVDALQTDPNLSVLRKRDDFRRFRNSLVPRLPISARRPRSVQSLKQQPAASKGTR